MGRLERKVNGPGCEQLTEGQGGTINVAGTARPSGLHLATPSAGRAELTEQVQSEAGASGRGSRQRVPCEPHAMMWHLSGTRP